MQRTQEEDWRAGEPLPCSEAARLAVRGLVRSLALSDQFAEERLLYGTLIARDSAGDQVVLYGVSGDGVAERGLVDSSIAWVPALTVEAKMVWAEAVLFAELAALKQELIELKRLAVRDEWARLDGRYAAELEQLAAVHRRRKADRRKRRVAVCTAGLDEGARAAVLAKLKGESRRDGRECRRLKAERDAMLGPLKARIAETDARMQGLKERYKERSQWWREQIEAAYLGQLSVREIEAVADEVLDDLVGVLGGVGLGDRAAAKLLYFATVQGLTPVALAEFWWEGGGRFNEISWAEMLPTEWQGVGQLPQDVMASRSLMAASQAEPLKIVYQDEYFIVVDKPAGLLSVPGRRYVLQDSVVSRLRYQLGEKRIGEKQADCSFLAAVHRLDQATSGLMVIATCERSHVALSEQFAQRRVSKRYEAILSRAVGRTAGLIDLPIGRVDGQMRRVVDELEGKPSLTGFEVLAGGDRPRVGFALYTGRTHQIRVHAAHECGLNAPIVGDELYGMKSDGVKGSDAPCTSERLLLHASRLTFLHPFTQETVCVKSDAPF